MTKFCAGLPLLFAVLPLVTGCATLTRGTSESYRVISDPPGALATLSSGESCTTPCSFTKKRADAFLVTIEKPGYKTYRLQVNSSGCENGRWCMLGNLLMFGSVIWASIDSLSGATQGLTPNPCEAKLVPAAVTPLPRNSRGECG